jgi:large subunit ribosomal protein L22
MTDQQTTAGQAVAKLKFARMAPRKLRRVADAIRGKSVNEALVLLQFAGVYAAKPLEKLVKSAVANAGNNHNLNTDDLYISQIVVDGGPGGGFTKRLDPRAQGRAYFKRKRLSHVTVVVSEEPPRVRRPRRSGASVSVKRPVRRTPAAAAASPAPAKKTTARKRSGPKTGSKKGK